MSIPFDKIPGMNRDLDRREFVYGMAGTAVVAGLGARPIAASRDLADASAPAGDYYPPALTGLHGSGYPEAFSIGHAIRDHAYEFDGKSATDTGESNELVVVGGGMPGCQGMDAGAAPASANPAVKDGVVGNSGFSTYHFPDGNATVVRMLVRALLPAALRGSTVTDSVTERLDYAQLDRPGATARIRLNSTVVRVRHAGDYVEFFYVRAGKLWRTRAVRCVLACWHCVIPYICPELPDWQREALSYQVKAPNLWVNVWLRNWQAFKRAGVRFINTPNGYYSQIILEHPLDIGAHHHPRHPDEPTKLTMLRGYSRPGLSVKEQYRLGRAEMFATSFDDFEREARQAALWPHHDSQYRRRWHWLDCLRYRPGIPGGGRVAGLRLAEHFLLNPAWVISLCVPGAGVWLRLRARFVNGHTETIRSIHAAAGACREDLRTAL